MELKGCPNGKQSTQECLDNYVFEFVEDTAYKMPQGVLIVKYAWKLVLRGQNWELI